MNALVYKIHIIVISDGCLGKAPQIKAMCQAGDIT